MKKSKSNFTKENSIQFPNEKISKLQMNNCYQDLLLKTENLDVDINHLENIFTDEIYYSAMKIVPLLERKVLYLSTIEKAKK